MHEKVRHQRQEDDARLALFFIFFCIACIALMGAVLTAYVYWGFQ
jgi:hypothetical protein